MVIFFFDMTFRNFYESEKLTKSKISNLVSKYTGEKLRTGQGRNLRAGELSFEKVRKGVAAEMEFADDLNNALEIALDHLMVNPHYYEDR